MQHFLCRMSCIGGCFYCYYLTRSHHSALSVAAAAVRKHHFSDRRVAHSIFNSKWSNLVTPYHVRFSKKMLRLELNLMFGFVCRFHGEEVSQSKIRWESGKRRRKRKNRAFTVTTECLHLSTQMQQWRYSEAAEFNYTDF